MTSTPEADRLDRERKLAEQAAAQGRAEDKFYRTLTAAHTYYLDLLDDAVRGRDVLEVGCGEGDLTQQLAQIADHVVGIDLSEGCIQRATQNIDPELRGSVTFRAMDAEQLAFPDASFDVVCGRAILHHLVLDRALGEIARVLKPGGKAIFLEALGQNPFINLYRRRSPEVRTSDEHPLLAHEVAAVARFGKARIRYFHLLALGALPFALLHEPTARAIGKPLQALDRFVFNVIPPTRRFAWIAVIELSDVSSPSPAVE
jgi:ubiquinone/menaquinone biosynthesis C-methylase UbiE